jgi:hypothetical protein
VTDGLLVRKVRKWRSRIIGRGQVRKSGNTIGIPGLGLPALSGLQAGLPISGVGKHRNSTVIAVTAGRSNCGRTSRL